MDLATWKNKQNQRKSWMDCRKVLRPSSPCFFMILWKTFQEKFNKVRSWEEIFFPWMLASISFTCHTFISFEIKLDWKSMGCAHLLMKYKIFHEFYIFFCVSIFFKKLVLIEFFNYYIFMLLHFRLTKIFLLR